MAAMLCPASLLAADAKDAATASLNFENQDWQLVCDNTRVCRAAGYSPESERVYPLGASALERSQGKRKFQGNKGPYPWGASVLLVRPAGLGQALTGMLQVCADRETPTLNLWTDGRDLGALRNIDYKESSIRLLTLAQRGAVVDFGFSFVSGVRLLAPAQVAALLDALLRDGDIYIASPDGRRWNLSSHGAAAALLKMDEFQGRLDTPGALTRKGKRAESSVLPALPALEVVWRPLPAKRFDEEKIVDSPELKAKLKTELQATVSSEDCSLPENLSGYSRSRRQTAVHRLDEHKLLISTDCLKAANDAACSYSYDRPCAGYWVINDSPPFQPRLVTTRGTGFSWGTSMISSSRQHEQGDRFGGCGPYSEWTWDGNAFMHTLEHAAAPCLGSGRTGGFWTLPTLVNKDWLAILTALPKMYAEPEAPQICSDEAIAAVAQWAEIPGERETIMERVGASACKRMPNAPQTTIAVVAFEMPPSGKHDYGDIKFRDWLQAITLIENGKVVAGNRSTIEEDSAISIGSGSYRIDTAPYRLAPATRAFGVVFNSDAPTPGAADASYQDELTLWIREGNGLRSVFFTYLYGITSLGPGGLREQEAHFAEARTTIAVEKTSQNGFADLSITTRTTRTDSRKGEIARWIVRYDGKSYRSSRISQSPSR